VTKHQLTRFESRLYFRGVRAFHGVTVGPCPRHTYLGHTSCNRIYRNGLSLTAQVSPSGGRTGRSLCSCATPRGYALLLHWTEIGVFANDSELAVVCGCSSSNMAIVVFLLTLPPARIFRHCRIVRLLHAAL
jgi:hypothetical protein